MVGGERATTTAPECSLAQGGVITIKAQAQNMHRGVRPATGKLDTRNQPHFPPRLSIIRRRGLVARHRVVIGDRQQVDIAGHGAIDKLAWSQGTIRGGGVSMKVNQHSSIR